MMAEDINNLFARLTFTEDEANQVVELNKISLNSQGHEAWDVGKIMSTEKLNREAMYRVLKSIWFTKHPGQAMSDYDFHLFPFWIRIYNIPFEQMVWQVAVDIGGVLGELLAIDWRAMMVVGLNTYEFD
ncbi:hypothetical protein J1N35_037237 [Gossypium stocksii]|uniref:DUF4283 domain-containing protein n=1 Tax=Gossypium stocksii TaxID=47602 RepID=A0A9D3UJS4_9ROSI|nr:hypothetical protein J1N35_037237 [Gossypium stocksii]